MSSPSHTSHLVQCPLYDKSLLRGFLLPGATVTYETYCCSERETNCIRTALSSFPSLCGVELGLQVHCRGSGRHCMVGEKGKLSTHPSFLIILPLCADFSATLSPHQTAEGSIWHQLVRRRSCVIIQTMTSCLCPAFGEYCYRWMK